MNAYKDFFLCRRMAVMVTALWAWLGAGAQESASVFSFLNLPTSAYAVSLGGQGSAAIENDASLVMSNPALMMSVEDKAINLNFTTYLQGMKLGSANYVQPHGDLGSWGVSAQFLSYGSAKETDELGNVLGSFTPIDLMLAGGYCRMLGERWSAGAMGKFIYSGYGSKSSLALAIDVGLNYYNEDKGTSLSLTGRNIGVQLKAFGDHRERLPLNIELGFSQRLPNTPLTFHVTLSDLNHWNAKDFSPLGEEVNFGKMFINHIIIGAELRLAKIIRVSIGYNFRRAYELKAAGSSHGAGLALGAGVYLKKFKFAFSWAKYHVSTSTLAFSAQYNL